MKFTIENLKSLEPCEPGFIWYLKNIKSENPREILLQLNNYRAEWARWLMIRLLAKEKNQKLAIFAAESVLEIYESKHPNNKEVRECIHAAKDYLAGKIDRDILIKKRNTADAAQSVAAAAYAAVAADAYAAAAADARKIVQENIINYACGLLEK